VTALRYHHDEERAARVRRRADRREVLHRPEEARLLYDDAGGLVVDQGVHGAVRHRRRARRDDLASSART